MLTFRGQIFEEGTDGLDPVHHIGVLGGNGLTAYFGLLHIGVPKAGETVLVSGAAGSVGHLVCQLAKNVGCRVVGVAGSEDKLDLLRSDLGVDAAVNYKSGDFRKELAAACPKGIDVYFDNTGGTILQTALFNMATKGRIVCCGNVSQYDTSTPEPGPRGVPGLLVNNRVRMEGFLVSDWTAEEAKAAKRELRKMIVDGSLKPWVNEFQGLKKGPEAFVDMLAGGNVGTTTVRVSS